MEIRIILGLFVILNLLLLVGADYDRKNVTKSRLDSNEVKEYQTKVSKNRKRKLDLAYTRPKLKMSQMLLQSNIESAKKLKMLEKTDPLEEGNRKILTFGKRVFQSIRKHGIMAKDVNLLNSGIYQIDWWKHNRRLQGMRKRLSEELEINSELKLRLQSLGWRNNSAQMSDYKKINGDNSDIETRPQNGDVKNCILYKILIMGFDNGQSETDSPTKFSLSTIDRSDFGATTSDFGAIDVMSGEMPTLTEEKVSTSNSNYLDDQVVDGDRFLQLIPLIVDELRRGLMSDEERRAFRGIFGKRLWQLLEREASKRLVQPMDYDLAKFLFKGELPKRESENIRRGRHQKQNDFVMKKKQKNQKQIRILDQKKNQQRDYDYEDKNYDDYKGIMI